MAAPPPQTLVLNTLFSLVETFNDFLNVSIHTILYSRTLYRPHNFITTSKYNLPVQQNRHPQVCTWICRACSEVQTLLLKGILRCIFIVIYSQDAEVIERWVFDVDHFPVALEEDALTELNVLGVDKVSLVDVEEQLRATIQKLKYCGERMAALPENSTFTVMVELKDKADPPTGHLQPWVLSEPILDTEEKGNSTTTRADLGGVRRMHVRTVEAGLFRFKAWVEEGKTGPNDDR
ncbi:related to MUS-26 protein MUS-26, involved in DNA repair [Phialocephala subalpina]|uniref:Related to MUS-26 protein MUS-26, involved in DNA repair n=1 Tax=Phialocephala subalpina TaxID=576137 RepID=A0A1L7XJS5_9HELO|nr:related to MUS-26 protein MUS-26, involved in DNA repair [Phialocephala subalpina]